jgi:type II secretory pathway component PulJ
MSSTSIHRPGAKRSSTGFSLLELVAATVLTIGVLAPALAVMRDSMAVSRELHRRVLLANYAVSILEDQAALVATNWTNETVAGDFVSDGHGDIRYSLIKSDDSSDGGLTDQLMTITSTVYDDANSDDALSAGELNETYRTKVAKLNTYENEQQ